MNIVDLRILELLLSVIRDKIIYNVLKIEIKDKCKMHKYKLKGSKCHEKIEEYVRSINDFPKEGIIFRDVTSVLQDADGLHLAIDSMQDLVKDIDFDVVVGPESRGFIFGVPIAYNLNKAFVPVRKRVNFHVRQFQWIMI